MQKRTFALRILLFLILPLSLYSQTISVEEALTSSEGEDILPSESVSAAVVVSGSDKISTSVVNLTNQPYDITKALDIDITGCGEHTWSITLKIQVKDGFVVNGGDVLFLHFYARGIATGDESGSITYPTFFRTSQGDYKTGSNSQDISSPADGEWKEYYMRGEAVGSSEGKTAAMMFFFGTVFDQDVVTELQLAKMRVRNFRNNISVEELPFMVTEWDGMEDDAPWRAKADARIESIRKSDIRLQVVDENANPIDDANVEIVQKKHKYAFSSALRNGYINLENSWIPKETVLNFRSKVLELFNTAGFTYYLKWGAYMNASNGYEILDESLTWLESNDMQTRGHTLHWPSWNKSPDYLKNEYDDIYTTEGEAAANNYLRNETRDHVTDYTNRWKDRLFQWDVVNEPYQNDDIPDILGNDIMVRWFQDAHAADPNCELFINENGIFTGPNEAKRTFYRNLVQYLLDNGAPLGGIGMQGHLSNTPVGMTEFLRRMNMYGKFNKKIEITEFDFFAENENVQAEYIGDALKMFYSYPLTSGFMFWGFYEESMAKPNAAIVNKDWTNRPAADTLKDLTRNQWWTNESGNTNVDGIYETRGYLGKYDIVLSYSGQSVTFNEFVDRDGLYKKVKFDGNTFTLLQNSTMTQEVSKRLPVIFTDTMYTDKFADSVVVNNEDNNDSSILEFWSGSKGGTDATITVTADNNLKFEGQTDIGFMDIQPEHILADNYVFNSGFTIDCDQTAEGSISFNARKDSNGNYYGIRYNPGKQEWILHNTNDASPYEAKIRNTRHPVKVNVKYNAKIEVSNIDTSTVNIRLYLKEHTRPGNEYLLVLDYTDSSANAILSGGTPGVGNVGVSDPSLGITAYFDDIFVFDYPKDWSTGLKHSSFEIYNLEDGNISPLQGAAIKLNNYRTFTGADGKATISGLIDGQYNYSVQKKGFTSVSDLVSVLSDTTFTDTLEVTDYRVTFTVKDVDSGEPVSGAGLVFSGTDYTTTAEGEAVIEEVSYSTYSIAVEKEGYEPGAFEAEIFSDTSIVLEISWDYITVQLNVVSRTTGTPLNRAQVTIGDLLYLTRSDGNATFDKATEVLFHYRVEADDYFSLEDSLTIYNDTSVTIALTPLRGKIDFLVTDGENPVQGVKVDLAGSEETTGIHGRAMFYNLPAREEYGYTIVKEGYYTQEDTLYLETDTTVTVALEKITGISPAGMRGE